MCAVVADAALHVQLSVRSNRHEPVVADRSGGVRAHGDSDTADLGTVPLSGARRALAPAKALGPQVERVSYERARGAPAFAIPLRGTEGRLAGRRVDLADLHLIEAELLGRLHDGLLHDRDALHFPGRPLE